MKIQLTITVEYDPQGASADELENRLLSLADYAAGEGLFTGLLDAEVITWEADTEVIEGFTSGEIIQENDEDTTNNLIHRTYADSEVRGE